MKSSQDCQPSRTMEVIMQSASEDDRPIVFLEDGGTGIRYLLHGQVSDVANMLFSLLADHPEIERLVVPNLIIRRMKAQMDAPAPSVNPITA